MHDCLAVSAELANPYWFYPKVVVQRQTCRHAQPTPTQPAIFQCARRPVGVLRDLRRRPEGVAGRCSSGSTRKDMAVDLASRSTTTPRTARPNFDHIQDIVEVFFLLQTADEAYHDGQARGLRDRSDQLARRPARRRASRRPASFFVDVEHDDVPPALYPGAPFRFSALTASHRCGARRSWASTPPRSSGASGPSSRTNRGGR